MLGGLLLGVLGRNCIRFEMMLLFLIKRCLVTSFEEREIWRIG